MYNFKYLPTGRPDFSLQRTRRSATVRLARLEHGRGVVFEHQQMERYRVGVQERGLHMQWALTVLSLIVVTVSGGGAGAVDYCEDINGNTIVVGEARYTVGASSQSCYANDYWDGGDELGMPLGAVLGGADPENATDLGFYSYVFIDDETTQDCASVTFELELKRNWAEASSCPDGGSTTTDTVTIDTCNVNSDNCGDDCAVYAGKVLGRDGFSVGVDQYWWRSATSVDSTGCTASDSGCWHVLDGRSGAGNECTLVNF